MYTYYLIDVDLAETVVETLWGVRSRFSMEEGPESKTFPTFEQVSCKESKCVCMYCLYVS